MEQKKKTKKSHGLLFAAKKTLLHDAQIVSDRPIREAIRTGA